MTPSVPDGKEWYLPDPYLVLSPFLLHKEFVQSHFRAVTSLVAHMPSGMEFSMGRKGGTRRYTMPPSSNMACH